MPHLNQTTIWFTNNIIEHEACTYGLEVVTKIKIKKLNVYGDSMLIICQVKGE
jgi:ribonuclease HI